MAPKPRKKPGAKATRKPAKKRKTGRPSKLTPELKEKICAAIRAGNYGEVAARANGIAESTYYRWMQDGREQRSGSYLGFYEAVKRAEAEGEAHTVAIIKKAAAEGDWRAAKALLELRYPERWRRRAQIEAQVAPERERLDLTQLSEKDLSTLEAINARAAK